MQTSLAEQLARKLGPQGLHDALTLEERQAFHYLWPAWARPDQIAPGGDWVIWLVLAGRGWGKSRTGAEWILECRKREPGGIFGLVGATADSTRKIQVFGESGILARCPPWDRPRFNVTDQALEWGDGTRVYLLSADKPDMARGHQFAKLWLDEIAAWRRMQETFDNLMMALRLGARPQACITTTPRPLALLRDIAGRSSTVVTRGKTTDNAGNLPSSFIKTILSRYANTTLGRQELDGELFDEMPGALWSRAWIDESRVSVSHTDPASVLAHLEQLVGGPLRRIVVGVDPATTSNEDSDECGIVVSAYADYKGVEHGYVLEDASLKASPEKWGRKVVDCVKRWRADCVVAETNLGGETIPAIIRLIDPNIRVIEKGGNRGKRTRAEPIAALYEQRRVHHVGLFPKMEDECCTYTLDTKKSPNNLDALVYSLGELMLRDEVCVLL